MSAPNPYHRVMKKVQWWAWGLGYQAGRADALEADDTLEPQVEVSRDSNS